MSNKKMLAGLLCAVVVCSSVPVLAKSPANEMSVESASQFSPRMSLTASAKSTLAISGQGFGNKTYYEEIVKVSNTSNQGTVGGTTWSNYASSTIKGVISMAVDGALDKLSLGSWSVAKLFVNPSVSANTQVTHKAHLVETKNCKHTYVVENGQKYFGSLTEQVTSSHFNNILIIPGKDPITGKNTSIPTKSTSNYSSADKKAYYSYVGSGYTETISGYTYGGAYYNSVTS